MRHDNLKYIYMQESLSIGQAFLFVWQTLFFVYVCVVLAEKDVDSFARMCDLLIVGLFYVVFGNSCRKLW